MKRKNLKFNNPGERILLALDVKDIAQALKIVTTLNTLVGGFKIGLELMHAILRQLFTLEWQAAVKLLLEVRKLYGATNGNGFWDGKFNDIPTTVKGAVEEVVGMKVKMLNIHASATFKAIQEAAAVKGNSLLLGVTVLTSFDNEECISVFGKDAETKVLEFARRLVAGGADGIICSAQELKAIRSNPEFDDFITVVPGTRSAGAKAHDQKRPMTPAEALAAGADFLVIGRQITEAADMVAATEELVKELSAVEVVA